MGIVLGHVLSDSTNRGNKCTYYVDYYADDQHLALFVKEYTLLSCGKICIRGQLLNSTRPINIEYVYQIVYHSFSSLINWII